MKREFTEDEILDFIQDLNPKLDYSKKNYIIDCPACGQRECSISVQAPYLWGCFRLKRCGEKGNIWTILKLLKKHISVSSFNRASELGSISLEKLLGDKSHKQQGVELDFNIEENPTISKPFGWERILQGDPYLDDRQFTSYNYCEVGRTTLDRSFRDYVIFLVREAGEIKGYVGRHTWSKQEIEDYNSKIEDEKRKIKRYKNSTGTNFSKLLYGYDEIDSNNIKPVILVEGIFDKHAIDSKLMLKKEGNDFAITCATFKAFISDTQIVKLLEKGVRDIILFYDPDVISIIQRNVQRLGLFFNTTTILADNNKDPDEMSQEELINQFLNKRYSVNQVLSDFIQVRL